MPKRTVTLETKFYTFRQNNSGGSFDSDNEKGIGINVIVEATDLKDALSRAERIGLYFNGDGDCPCCGDRWSEPWQRDGNEVPMIYEQNVSNGKYEEEYAGMHEDIGSYIHYIDGLIQAVKHVKAVKKLKDKSKEK